MLQAVSNWLWRRVAWLVTRGPITRWLIARAWAHPYSDITSRDGREIYMRRGWVFNPYGKDADGKVLPPRLPWLPSIRVHHIMREDRDRHLHDHPWNARTIVLHGWYSEERKGAWYSNYNFAGYTGRLLFGEYHRITRVPKSGVYTLFFTWKKRGSWGFDVDGVKVHYREYLKND